MKKIMIDSDICLDSITARIPYQYEADRLFDYVERGKMTGIVSAESFSNIFYILRKLSSSKKAIQQIKNLRTIVNVGRIHETTVDSALNADWNDFEDALQYFCAIESNCEAIVTRNISDFNNSEIPVFTPNMLLDKHFS